MGITTKLNVSNISHRFAFGNKCYLNLFFFLSELWAVVNNAALVRTGPVEIAPLEMYKEVSDVNLFGTIRVTKTFLPLLRQSKGNK